ncbi:hypothetical protein Tco_0025606 [Tanacetum coccineum]
MNSSMCFALIGRVNIYSGNPFPFIGKGIRVYKFNLHYVASIKWVVKLPFNARLLSSTRIFSRLVNLLEVKQYVSTSVKEIDYAQLRIVNQAELKLFLEAFFSFCTTA